MGCPLLRSVAVCTDDVTWGQEEERETHWLYHCESSLGSREPVTQSQTTTDTLTPTWGLCPAVASELRGGQVCRCLVHDREASSLILKETGLVLPTPHPQPVSLSSCSEPGVRAQRKPWGQFGQERPAKMWAERWPLSWSLT